MPVLHRRAFPDTGVYLRVNYQWFDQHVTYQLRPDLAEDLIERFGVGGDIGFVELRGLLEVGHAWTGRKPQFSRRGHRMWKYARDSDRQLKLGLDLSASMPICEETADHDDLWVCLIPDHPYRLRVLAGRAMETQKVYESIDLHELEIKDLKDWGWRFKGLKDSECFSRLMECKRRVIRAVCHE